MVRGMARTRTKPLPPTLSTMDAKLDRIVAAVERSAQPLALRQGMPIETYMFEAWAHVRAGRVIGIFVGFLKHSRIEDGDMVVPLTLAPFGTKVERKELRAAREAWRKRRSGAEARADVFLRRAG